jgi:hypothetical protein
MGDDEAPSWSEQRRMAAAVHAAADQRRREAQTARARLLVTDFVAQARERGLRAEPLVARPYSGRGSCRTPLTGWYLRADRSLAVGTDGEFYVLTVPASLSARFTGAHIAPQEPPLDVGVGGKDGDSIALDSLLRKRLDAGDDWPA